MTQTAVFASGCFWSKEYIFQRTPGVVATRVGYTGGHVAYPTYKDVCSKTTGHAEAVEITYDPSQISFEDLAKVFFETHDPTIDRRDKGGQYRSAIFYQNEAQLEVAQQLMAQLEERGMNIVTTLESAGTFWQAEERHQQYCDTHQMTPRVKRKKRF